MSKKDVFLIGKVELIRKDNTLFYYKEKGESFIKGVLPVNAIDEIYTLGHVQMTNEVLNLLGETNISMHFFDFHGRYRGSFIPFKHKSSPRLLFEQYKTQENLDKRVFLSKQLVEGTSVNLLKNIQYKMSYDGREEDIQKMKDLMEKLWSKEVSNIEQVMGIEANIRKRYFSAFDKELIHCGLQEFCLDKRVTRPPNNAMNALISFINMLVYSTMLNQIYKTPLDPRIGFLHTSREYRYALSLDMSEIFKPLITDRIILKLLRRKQIKMKHFDTFESVCFLNGEGRKIVLNEYKDTLEKMHPIHTLKRDATMKYTMQLECYKIIKFMLEDAPYNPFTVTK